LRGTKKPSTKNERRDKVDDTEKLTVEIRKFIDSLNLADIFQVFVCPAGNPFVDGPTTGYTRKIKVEGTNLVIRNLTLTDFVTDDAMFISKLEVPLDSYRGIVMKNEAHFRAEDKDVYIRPQRVSDISFIDWSVE
jgi:hypothetical protein